MENHKHYWFYPHAIIDGLKDGEFRVVRYCECGKRQMAIINRWVPATGPYKLDEHYN